jgi:hypothetical protein
MRDRCLIDGEGQKLMVDRCWTDEAIEGNFWKRKEKKEPETQIFNATRTLPFAISVCPSCTPVFLSLVCPGNHAIPPP